MVSVVIPSFNRAQTIDRSIRSVLNQTYTDIEVIVVDDCSIDDTQYVVNKIKDHRVHYDRLELHSGPCVARNHGIDIAKGEYIAFQDSDDFWLPDKLEIQLRAINESGADICFCSKWTHSVDDRKTPVLWPPLPNRSGEIDHIVLRRKSMVSTQTIVAKTVVFQKVRFDPKVIESEDYDWIIRASEQFKVYFVSKPLVEQYTQKDSITLSDYKKKSSSKEYFLKKYAYIYEQDPEFEYNLLHQVARYKALSGRNSLEEYKKLYQMKKTPKDLLKLILSKVNLIRYFLKK